MRDFEVDPDSRSHPPSTNAHAPLTIPGVTAQPCKVAENRNARRTWRAMSVIPLGTFLFTCLGCGITDGLDRLPITGEVAFDGKPLAAGLIYFEPVEGSESGTPAGAKIRLGKFSVSRREGLVAGEYQVRIYASSSTQAPPGQGRSSTAPRPMIDLIPARYNGHTTLRSTVTRGGANAFRFSLTSDPDRSSP